MTIVEVISKKEQRIFLHVNYLLNKHLQFYIRPLNKPLKEHFKNQTLNTEEVAFKRWILYSEKKQPIGRILAFTHTQYKNVGTDFKCGGVGFFECINNQEAANLLFDTAKSWLISKQVEAMDGPINFNNREQFSGLLIEGLHDYPIYGLNFNPTYYKTLFEQYGFKEYYKQFYYLSNGFNVPNIVKQVSDRLLQNKSFRVDTMDLKNFDKFVEDFVTVYNKAWAQHSSNKQTTPEKFKALVSKIKPFMNTNLTVFAYKDNQPIGFFITIKDVNNYIKDFNGKLHIFNLLRLFYRLKIASQPELKLFSFVFGVVPEYQNSGVSSALISKVTDYLKSTDAFNEIELGWAGDWNPKAVSLYQKIGKLNRILITYRYIFNEKKHPFQKHPIIEY